MRTCIFAEDILFYEVLSDDGSFSPTDLTPCCLYVQGIHFLSWLLPLILPHFP